VAGARGEQDAGFKFLKRKVHQAKLWASQTFDLAKMKGNL